MWGSRLSPAVRGAVGITLVALTVATVTVLLHRARFERTLLALTEERLAFVAADMGARIQSGLDLGLDLPAMANVQAILDGEVQGDPAITAVEVLDEAGKVLFRGGPAGGASVADDRQGAVARPEPARAADGGADVTGPGDPGGGGAGVAWFDAGSGLIAGRSKLVDIFGGDAGSLVLTYSRSSVGEATGAMTSLLIRAALVILPVTFGLAWLLTRLVLRERTHEGTSKSPRPGERARHARGSSLTGPARPWRRLPVVLLGAATLAVLLLLEAVVSVVAVGAYERHLEPELRSKADALGRSLRRQVERALGLGIPIDALVDMDGIVALAMRGAPELVLVALADPDGEVVYARGLPAPLAQRLIADVGRDGDERSPSFGDLSEAAVSLLERVWPREGAEADRGGPSEDHRLVTLPLTLDGLEAGRLHLAVSPAPLRRQLGDALLEAAVVAAGGGLFAVELLVSLFASLATHAAGGGVSAVPTTGAAAAGVAAIRLPVFLLVAGGGLVLPFLPAFVAGHVVAGGGAAASLPMLVALPISLAAALAGMGAALGRLRPALAHPRRTFLTAAGLAAVGLLAAAHAQGNAQLAAALDLSGLGLGLALAAARGLAAGSGKAARARAVVLPGGVLSALSCGPALGGMLAEVVGFRATFLASAAFAGAAAVLACLFLAGGATAATARPRQAPPAFSMLLGNWRLLALGLLAAAPAGTLATGLAAYAVPRYLAGVGAGWAEIGRIVMLWALPLLILTPAFGALVDRWRGQGPMAALGGIVAGTGLAPALFVDARAWIPAAMLLLGAGQAMSLAGLPRLAVRIARPDIAASLGHGPVLAALRGFGWLGAACGPLAAAGLLAFHDDATALALLGLIGASAAVLLGTLLLFAGYEPEPSLAGSPPTAAAAEAATR